MKFRTIRFCATLSLLALAGCDRSESVSQSPTPSKTDPGKVAVSVNLGKVGVLARAQQMSPTKLLLQFTMPNMATLEDTITVTGSGSVAKSYTLASFHGWTLRVTGLDQRDSVLYSGSSTFNVSPNASTNVNLSLDARYSSLRVRFPVRDSLTRFVLSVDGAVWGDSSVATQSRVGDTVKFNHDYLEASPGGTSHTFSLQVYGSQWGQEALFYAFDTTLNILSGSDLGRTLTLKWVGTNLPPPGQATLSVTLGTVGQVDFGVAYEDTATAQISTNDGGIPWNPAINYGTLLDSRDGHSYRTVQIGSQTWMAENLNFAGAGVCYNNAADSCAKYGRLYNWAEVMKGAASSTSSPSGIQGVCPTNWHLPSDVEWDTLAIAVGGTFIGWESTGTGTKLKSTFGWSSAGNGTDLNGFRVLPGGTRYPGANPYTDGSFGDAGSFAYFWSASDRDSQYAWYRYLNAHNESMYRAYNGKSYRFSARCLMNAQ